MANTTTHQDGGASTTDVVVVGGGGAGLAAAIEAASLGRDVVLLEKNPALGGTTAWSVGSITATCTPFQIRKGIKDSPREHFEDMALFAGELAARDNLVLRHVLTDNLPDTFAWLLSLGVDFIGPMPEPPHRYPRMHNVLPNSRAYIYHLARRCRKLGVEIRLNTRVTQLLLDGRRVTGVKAAGEDGGRHTYLARGGVVLASGDYSADPEMKATYISPDVAEVEPINVASTGDGQRLGMRLGARILNGDLALGPEIRFVPPRGRNLIQALPPIKPVTGAIRWSMEHAPSWVLRPFLMMFLTTALAPSPNLFREGAILVNRNGERFTDEMDRPAYALPKQPEKTGYIVFDHKLATRFSEWPYFISTAPGVAYAYLADYRRNRRDIFHRARTVGALAAKIGANKANLEKAIAEYNEALATGEGKPSQAAMRQPLTEAPFYGLGPTRSYMCFTDGGLSVTPRLEVTDAGGEPISGLFAAGSAGQGGLLLEGHGHHIGWALTSGRIAGRNAAFGLAPEPAPDARSGTASHTSQGGSS